MPRTLLYAACAAVIFTTSACGADALIQTGEDAAPVVSPAEMDSALQGREMAVRRFYAGRRNKAAWSETQTDALRTALGQAERHGLDPAPYLALIPADGGPAARDVGLTRAALAYAGALSRGAVDPARVNGIWELDRNGLDPAPGLARALAEGEVGVWLASLPPQDREYAALSEAYLRYRKLAAQGRDWPQVPAGAKLKPGVKDARLAAVQARLRLDGYLPESQPGEPAPQVYDRNLVEAVKRFQADHGLNADGVIGPDTAEALSEGPAERAGRIAVNLERRRWLSRIVPDTRIDVNTAATFLTYWRDGRPVRLARVVVGRPKDPTPALGSPFSTLVVNPPWNVPESIATEELAPKGRAYLRRIGMSWKNGQLVQRPGPDNSLGLVKFDMENPHAIYMHDTPAKELFQKNERHLSHGCVRVDGALDFARALAAESGKEAEFDAALASGETTRVELDRSISVRLLYHTVYLAPDGRVAFRPDVYGWDEELARAMGVTGPKRLAAAADVTAPLGP